MAGSQFVKQDTDLLGLLKGNRTRVVRELDRAYAGEGGIATGDALRELWREKEDLRDEMLRSLDTVNGQIDTISQSLNGNIDAQSDLGKLVADMQLLIEANATAIKETYQYAETLSTEDAEFQTSIMGTIRRGFLTDPGSADPIFGIAISENLQFTANVRTQDGEEYYELAPGQTLGLYTAHGWQFYINGEKAGWFDSVDGMLHVASMTVENRLLLDRWVMETSGGFGLRYLG